MGSPKDPEKRKLWLKRIKEGINRKAISKANKGKHLSPETEFKKGHAPSFMGWKGQKFTKKHKKNLSKAHIGNPGYWKGKCLYKSVVKQMSQRAIKQMNSGKTLFGYGISGKRKDLNNTFFRSRWEANYARYLNLLNVEWKYEPRTFWFNKIKKGCITYTPDFYLPTEDIFVEIKGWFTDKSKTKLKRFAKYYPQYFKKLIIVIKDPWSEGKADIKRMRFLEKLEIPLNRIESYKEIEDKLGGLIPNWE